MRRLMLVVMAVGAMACGGDPEARGVECWAPALDESANERFSKCVPPPEPETGAVHCEPLTEDDTWKTQYSDEELGLPCDQKFFRLESAWLDDAMYSAAIFTLDDERAYLVSIVCDCP